MRRKFHLWKLRQRMVHAHRVPDEWIYQAGWYDKKGRLCFPNGSKWKVWGHDNMRCYTYVY